MKKEDEAALHPTISRGSKAAHAANRVMFAILKDDLPSALEWGKQLSEYPAALLGFAPQCVPIRLLIAQGKKEAAREWLQRLYAMADQADAMGLIIKIRVYQALAAETPDEAVTFLADALVKGEPEGFIRTFVDEGRLLAPLLHKALSQGITPEYTAKLLDIIETEDLRRRAAKVKETPTPTSSSEFLSQRELEVLCLVAEGLSNQQIAQKLTISLNTAKTHVSHLFDKLNAKDRLQAVTRAKELKLI
ncbi:MAG: response regulator transcription factor [Chloroflexi bacterium]|nr:response regulator transcription factor [Chloroflexota bacterium]